MNNIKARAQKRITLDYQQLLNNPLRGISMCQINDHDFYNFIVNIEILYGVLKGLKLQLTLQLGEKFPNIAPKIYVESGQSYFKYPLHHHVFTSNICMDLLSNGWMDPKALGSGWTSAYTFSTILLQLQTFLSDPDLYGGYSETYLERVKDALEKQKDYEKTLYINGTKIVHTWDNPYPKFPKEEKVNRVWGTPLPRLELIKEKLTCYILKENTVDYKDEDGRLALGYPIDLNVDDFDRLHPVPIPEILSYIGYRSELENNNVKLDKQGFPYIEEVYKGYWRDFKYKYSLKSGFGNGYNSWMPIYVNNDHFQRNLKRIEYQLQVFKYGFRNKDQTFQPGLIFEIFPTLLNKLVVYLLDGTVHQSIAALEAYIHFAKTFREFIKLYKDECYQIISKKVEDFKKCDELRCKRSLGDIGEFVQILMISNEEFYQDKQVMDSLFREVMARQILWIIKAKAQAKFKAENEKQDMEFSFNSQKISVQLFIFVIEVAKSFGRESFLDDIEDDFCIPEEKVLVKFVKKLAGLKKSIKNYKDWFFYLGFDYFSDDQIYERFLESYKLSNEQGYTFEAEIFDFRKKAYYDELKESQRIERERVKKEREEKRKERDEKRQKQIQERNQKDMDEILAYNDSEQVIVDKLNSQIKIHDQAKEIHKKSLQQLEDELYLQYFGNTKDDPFAMYKDEKKLKQYEKELKLLKQKETDKVVKKRQQEQQLQKQVDYMEDKKLELAQDKIQKRQQQREKEDLEREKKYNAIRFQRQEQYLQRQREKQMQRDVQKQRKEEHRKNTNNGLGFDRREEYVKKERVEKQQNFKKMVKNNMFYALDDETKDEWQMVK